MGTQQVECQRSADAADYVLGKLEGRRLEAFERHVRVCERCQTEVELLQYAADAVPYLASTPAPAEVQEANPRRQIPSLDLAAAEAAARTAATKRKLDAEAKSGSAPTKPPLKAIPGGATEREPAPEIYEGLPPHATVLGHGPVIRARREHTRPVPRPVRSARRILKNPVPKPAMVGLVGVAIVAIATVALSHRAASIRFERVKAGWSSGGAAIRLEGGQLEVLVIHMPRPQAGNGYQVWVMNRSSKQLTPTSAWLRLNRAGEAGINVPGNYHDWDAAAIYVEPLHGRETTKSGAVVVADLRAEA